MSGCCGLLPDPLLEMEAPPALKRGHPLLSLPRRRGFCSWRLSSEGCWCSQWAWTDERASCQLHPAAASTGNHLSPHRFMPGRDPLTDAAAPPNRLCGAMWAAARRWLPPP